MKQIQIMNSFEDIKTTYINLRKDIRQYISQFLDTQENQMYKHLILNESESQGISDCQKPYVDIYKNPKEDLIYFEFDSEFNSQTEDSYIELDEVTIDLLIEIIQAIENL